MRVDRYRTAAKTYDLVVGSLTRSMRRRRRQIAPPTRGLRVLDIGCGTGADLQPYARAGARVFGVDRSPSMLRVARRRLGSDADLRLCDAVRLPFPDDTFDLVMASLTLHEIAPADRGSVIGQMRRVLRNGGKILLTDYQPSCYHLPQGWWSALIIYILERTAGPEHYTNGRHFLRSGGLCALVHRCGLRVEKRSIVGGGNIALYLLSSDHSGVYTSTGNGGQGGQQGIGSLRNQVRGNSGDRRKDW